MKKVLIITYYWPPAGGPGVQRVLKFVKYLPQFGWEPIVLTVENGEYPAIDESLLNEIPENLKVYKTKSFEPFNLYKKVTGQKGNIPTHVLSKSDKDSFVQTFFKWIRANLFVPDARIGWISTIVREGLKIVEIEKPDLIFSSSPPHSLQIGAMKLAKKTGLKWVADFRDPWTDAFWQKDINRINIALKKDKKFEHAVLSSANALITVSNSIANDFNEIEQNKCSVIPNGFDPSDFTDTNKINDGKFRITYTGTLGKDQKIDNLLSAIKELYQKFPNDLEVNFYGNLHKSILERINQKKLGELISIHESVPHDQIVNIMFNSEILILVIPDAKNNKGIVTGKLFEYLATRNYVLGIGPVDGDASNILEETNCGKMFDFSEDLSRILKDRFSAWKNNEMLDVNENALLKYSRVELTKQLTDIFMKVQ